MLSYKQQLTNCFCLLDSYSEMQTQSFPTPKPPRTGVPSPRWAIGELTLQVMAGNRHYSGELISGVQSGSMNGNKKDAKFRHMTGGGGLEVGCKVAFSRGAEEKPVYAA